MVVLEEEQKRERQRQKQLDKCEDAVEREEFEVKFNYERSLTQQKLKNLMKKHKEELLRV